MFSDQECKQAYEDGYQAREDGENKDANPYVRPEHEELYRAWQEGYYDAGWDD